MNRKSRLINCHMQSLAVYILLFLTVLTAGTGCSRQIIVRTADDFHAEEMTAAAEETRAAGSSETEQYVTEQNLIYVHVSGMVLMPGVYALHRGDRVFHAVDAAGGFLPDADRDWCNLAEELADADKLRIYSMEETAAMEEAGMTPADDCFGMIRYRNEPASVGTGEKTGGDTGTVNLNTAGVEELMTLPGIGQKRAEDIVAYRQMNGGFSSVEELTNISGIGNSMLQKLSGMVTV